MFATGRSLVQGSATEYGVSECDREVFIMRRPLPTRGLSRHEQKETRLLVYAYCYVLVRKFAVFGNRYLYGQFVAPTKRHKSAERTRLREACWSPEMKVPSLT